MNGASATMVQPAQPMAPTAPPEQQQGMLASALTNMSQPAPPQPSSILQQALAGTGSNSILMDALMSKPAAPKPKPKFFGKGGLGWDILGSIGDALSDHPSYWPYKLAMQRQAHDDQRQEQQDMLTRLRILADLQPKAAAPTNTQRTYEYLKTVRPDLAEQWLTNQTTAPPLVVPNPDGTRTVYPGGSIPRGPATAAPQSSPTLPPGYSVRPKGGAPSQGGATFR